MPWGKPWQAGGRGPLKSGNVEVVDLLSSICQLVQACISLCYYSSVNFVVSHVVPGLVV